MSKLYVVPTPIGNLEDMSFRAVRILKDAQLILAEDTRVSGNLLRHFEISTPCIAHHQHNEHKTTEQIIGRLQRGERIALISDAGTPAISDPGFLLVRACIEADIEVECLPGATAFVPALVNSGLSCERFIFEGFLPHKKGRNTRLQSLISQDKTMILYESPHRLVKTLEQLAEYLGKDRKACVSREISKFFEENKRGSLAELSTYYNENPPKGEIVICIEGCGKEWFAYPYPRPALTVDAAIFAKYENKKYILLVNRLHEPFANTWALPGGFVEEDETLEWAVVRELKEETSLRLKDYEIELKAFKGYSEPDRDPRGRTISMVYSAIFDVDELPEVKGRDDAKEAKWINLENLPTLAFDHAKILHDLRSEIGI